MVREINEKLRANFPISALIAFGIVIAAAVWSAATLNNKITLEFLEINRQLAALDAKIVGKGPHGWHYQQMDRFCVDAQALNPGWTCPDPRKIIDKTYTR